MDRSTDNRNLATKLKSCRVAGRNITDPDAVLAVAELFCRFSRYDAGKPDLRDAAVRSMSYVEQMPEAELRRADEVLAGRTNFPVIPTWRSAVGVAWHDGSFWSGGEPIFLSGFNWDAAEARDHPGLLKRLGVNLVDGMLQERMTAPGAFDDASFEAGQGAYLRQMNGAGLAVDCLLGVTPPRWMINATPELFQRGYGNGFDYVLEHPRAVAYRQQIRVALGAHSHAGASGGHARESDARELLHRQHRGARVAHGPFLSHLWHGPGGAGPIV